MEPLVRILFAFLPMAWTASAAAYAGVLLGTRGLPHRLSRPLTTFAVLLHLAALAGIAACGMPPVASAGGLVGTVGLACAMIYLWLERRIGNRSTGVFPTALAAVMTTVGNALGDPLQPVSRDLLYWPVAGHVVGAILGYAGLALAAVFGTIYLLQYRAMRAHRFGGVWERLPSLQLLEDFGKGSHAAAFVFLTITIGFGHATRSATGIEAAYTDPKILATNALWLLTGIVLLGAWSRRFSQRLGAWAAVALLGLAILNVAAVDLFSTLH